MQRLLKMQHLAVVRTNILVCLLISTLAATSNSQHHQAHASYLSNQQQQQQQQLSQQAISSQHQQQQQQQQQPSIIPFHFNQNVQENETVTVICATLGVYAPVSFIWLKDEQYLQLPKSTEDFSFEENSSDSSSTLKISSVRLDHAGNYTCVARNAFGFQRHSAQLVVHRRKPSSLLEPLKTRPSNQTSVADECRRTTGCQEPLHIKNNTVAAAAAGAARHRRQSSSSDDVNQASSTQVATSFREDQFNHYEEPMALSGDEQDSSAAASSSSQHQQQQQQQSAQASAQVLSSSSSSSALNSGRSSSQARGKRTLYACEEKQLEIECQLGESIQLIRANYGRFSIQICNENGQLDWKVNCMSPESFNIIDRSCQAKQSCKLLASNDIFGDACPGTQKYLEVHYQCTPANRTQHITQGPAQPRVPNKEPGNNVILHQPHDTTTIGVNSDSGLLQPSNVKRPPWQSTQVQSSYTSPVAPPLPNWIHASLNANNNNNNNNRIVPSIMPNNVDSTTVSSSHANGGDAATVASRQPNADGAHSCPEIVWRNIRWPATEAGQAAQMPCPAHTAPTQVPYAAWLYCTRDGQWADRMQAGRCQSFWLRNLTQRLDAGDSPLSILFELVQRTQQASASQSGGGGMSAGTSLTSGGGANPASNSQQSALFGDDLVQIARVVARLVEEMDGQLGRISDDKQRISFARSMIQLLVDLVSNLIGEQQQQNQHSDAWSDLAASGERQRVAGQLVAGLEAASVLLAGALQQSSGSGSTPTEDDDFHKITDSVYVAIQTFELDPKRRESSKWPAGLPGTFSQNFQVTFPNSANVLGTRWMASDQRFTLNLNAANTPEVNQQTGQISSGQLKIVSVMLRGLGAQMEPIAVQRQQQQTSDKSSSSNGDVGGLSTPPNQQRRSPLVVNSDLVSFSIVANPVRNPIKVDLLAPIELVFRHNDQQQQQQHMLTSSGVYVNSPQQTTTPTITAARQATAYCVSWDTNTSDWSLDGCKLVATNQTHSVCACNHLTTFALLNELDQTLADAAAAGAASGAGAGVNDPQFHSGAFNRRPFRVNLDSVDQELILEPSLASSSSSSSSSPFDGQQQAGATIKSIYMAKLLEGNLFSNQQGARTFLYASCCPSAFLLAVLLGAAAYNRAHARRLLGSMPVEPPPSLLVANYHNNAQQQQQLVDGRQGPLIETSTTTNTTRTSPPTSYSSNGVSDLMVKQDAAAIMGQEDEMNGFYSLIGGSANQYCTAAGGQQQSMPAALAHGSSYYHLASAAGNTKAKSAKRTPSISHLALVPIHLIFHLLLLQLLVILLIESQNFLQWNSQQWKRTYMQDQATNLGFASAIGSFNAAAEQQQQQQQQTDVASSMLAPIGTVTWLVVLALYYLASTLVCWLLAKLIQLNGHLFKLNSKLSAVGGKSSASAKSYQHPHAPIQTLSGSIYQQHQQMPANRYGQCQIHNQQQQQLSGSPTLSTFSNSMATDQRAPHQQDARLYSGQPQLNKLMTGTQQQHSKEPIYVRHALMYTQAKGKENCLVRVLTSDQLAACLTHLGPFIVSALLVWLTYDRVQLINLLSYTTSISSQVAYWPLAVNASWSFPLAALLYCLPTVCLALGIMALVGLSRRHYERICGPTSLLEASHSEQLNKHHHNLEADLGGIKRGQQVSGGAAGAAAISPSARYAVELSIEGKRAKFVCLTLLALLCLNSICWISFFIHCHQAISQTTSLVHSQVQQQQQQQQQQASSGNHLVLAFASSNLLISVLICCSQRRQLKRAGHLLGLSRFMLAVSKGCCRIADATKGSPASSSSASSSSYYGQQQQQQQHQQQQHHHEAAAQHLQQQQQQHYGTGKSIKISSAPSQQSLFVVSRSRPVGQNTNYGSGPGGMSYGLSQHYPVSNQQQQQHLYQQLAAADSQQHIYDSTTNLNGGELMEHQRQDQLGAVHLMGHNNLSQQQPQQQQQPTFNHTLGRAFNLANITGPNFYMNHRNQQVQLQQQYQYQFNENGGGNTSGPSLTLKPNMHTGNALSHHPYNHQQQQQAVVPFSPHHHQQQQQQQAGVRRPNLGSNGATPHDLLMCPISGGGQHMKTHSASSAVRLQQQQQQQQVSTPSSASSSGEADGPLVALAKTTLTTTTAASIANNNNNSDNNNSSKQHQFSIATNQSTPATFGPTIPQQQQQQHNSSRFPLATEHRQSDDCDQSFALIRDGHAGAIALASNQNSGSNNNNMDATSVSGQPIRQQQQQYNFSMTSQKQQQQQQSIDKQQHTGQNYTEALKTAMAQEANQQQQQQQHFRRANSATRRQQ